MTEQQKQDAPDPALVQATVDQVLASLAYTLDDEVAAQVRGRVERQLKLAAKLRAYPLRNADEPDFIFRPHRTEE
jgi:hypothetical protein